MASVLKANAREDLRRSATRQLRSDGSIPAILYGGKDENQTVSVDAVDLIKTIREVGRNGIITLEIDGDDKRQVMIYEMQRDPIKDEYTHIDFFEVDMTTEIDVDIPVRLTGSAAGEMDGGIVSQLMYEIAVRCLPGEIPEVIEIDVTELEIGDTIQISDVRSKVSVEITNEDEEAIVTVQAPSEEKEEVVSDEDELLEPEVIGEEADDEEEEEE